MHNIMQGRARSRLSKGGGIILMMYLMMMRPTKQGGLVHIPPVHYWLTEEKEGKRNWLHLLYKLQYTYL